MNYNYPTPYLVGKIFHFRYTSIDGRRVRMSTGFSRKTDAKRFIQEFVDKQRSGIIDTTTTVRDVLRLYQDTSTNPKRQQALVTTAPYSERYAKHTATHAKDLETVLNKSMKKFLDKPISAVIRYEIKQAAVVIVNEYGSCNKSMKLYKVLKALFGQAADDGMIQMNTAQGLSDIRYKSTTRKALPTKDIQLVLSHPEIFPNKKAQRLFTLFAMTGLRRSELLAISPEQLKGDVLTVDRAYKDDSLKIIGTPKWDKIRVIPLCDTALTALKEAFEEDHDSDEPLRISSRMLSIWFNTIRTHALALDLERPEAWKELTPHVLRHSLNTNLRLSGMYDILVAEYLSWEHQGMNAVQEGYTHVYANNLRPVSDKIEVIYGDKKKSVSRAG